MTTYISQFQTKIEEFKTPFELKLSPDNRWVKLAALLPWDTLASIYHNKLSSSMGRTSVNARVVIGALIIKHKLNLTDDETLLTISENPYMQFFLGLEVYQPDPLFSPTLFVEIRKRLGEESFDEFNKAVIRIAFPQKDIQAGEQCENKGKLQIDDYFSQTDPPVSVIIDPPPYRWIWQLSYRCFFNYHAGVIFL